MDRHWTGRLLLGALLATLILAAPATAAPAATPAGGPPAAPPAQAENAFLNVWARADWPLKLKVVSRAWTWGPQPLDRRDEPFAESPGGARPVLYWDKARMEINNPAGNPNDPWYVTNGLLVVELVSGRMQIGNTTYQDRGPSTDVVVGDNRAANPDAPSYAAFRGVASLGNENTFPDRTNQPITGYMAASGQTARSDTLLGYNVRYARYVPQTQHNIPDRFWSYLQQPQQVYVNGQLVTAPLYDWVYLTGYPISEAYWVTARIGGKPYAVLVQLFQRRVLTYIPAFAPEWQLQMGNVGQHYHTWRYGK